MDEKVGNFPLSEGVSVSRDIDEANAESVFDGKKILVIDDDESCLSMVVAALNHSGAEIYAASSADEGLKRIRENDFNLIISDIGMPDKDGYQFINEVRKTSQPGVAQIPAIALTAYVGDTDIEEALDGGFQSHIKKPVDLDVLNRAVMRLLKD